LAPPEGECVELCAHEDGMATTCQDEKQLTRWLRRPPASGKGPSGEHVVVVLGKRDARVEARAADGSLLAQAVVDMDGELAPGKRPNSSWRRPGAVFWRPGGGGVAVILGYSDEEEARSNRDPEATGYAAVRHVAVMHWRAPADAPPDARAAGLANSAGMQRYRAKDYAGAATEFRRAIVLDPSHLLAHYNLACVETRLGRDDGADELRWLARRNDAAADERLVKAARDPDLRPLLHDADIARLVDGAVKRAAHPPKTCADACERDFDRCSDACPEGDERVCGRICGRTQDACVDKCPP
ncbi:MAG TPA: hypothetical protein VHB97_15960, partial [Polyangia bacterium]|nr:hypothetical protein [Polyangia bacterium]